MQLKNVIEGVHNKEQFRYENGKIHIFGRVWDKEDIQTLVQIANLLEVQGYKLKIPTGRESRERYDMFFGGTLKYDVKTYDDEKGEDSHE